MTAGRDALRAAVDNFLATPEVRDALERFAAEQVAAALNSAADEVPRFSPAVIAHWLHARAAAALAAPDNDRRQG